MDDRERVRTYYEALDDHDYERLSRVLSPDFVHERSDRTLGDREEFVQFMRDERPLTETTHRIEELYANDDGSEFVVLGRLLDSGDELLFTFLDRFVLGDDRIERLQTFTPS